MDLEMPVMDEITAVRHLRAHTRTAWMRAPARHGADQQRAAGQIDAALAAGMDEVIVRPYRFPRLVKAVHLAVDRAERGEWGARE
jgi:CheY-like chemotaxis protein